MDDRGQEAAFLQTLTLLYVEDEPNSREEMARFLRRRCGTVVTAADGVDGLAAFKAQPAQIVVTDIQMPNLNGLAMAQAIRGLDPAIPIIVTTAFEQPDYLERSVALGIDQYVLKPIQAERLEFALMTCAHRLLAEQQLLQKRRIEAEAIRIRHQLALSVLLGDIANDYENLLQQVLTAMFRAKTKLDPASEASRILDQEQSSLERASFLGSRLLRLTGASDRQVRVGSLDQLIQNTVQETLDGSLTTQAFHSRAGEVPVNYMEANLAHAFRIVAQNAREAMPAGGTLHVSTEICTIPEPRQPNILPGRYLQIGFRDTGPGVRPEHLPKVFDPVFSTKERSQQGGAGLGLASCEAIIRAHGGFMTADSQPGQGAMFQIYLPFALEKRRCSREG